MLAPTDLDEVDREHYAEAKVACERLSGGFVGGRLLVARSGLIGGPGDRQAPTRRLSRARECGLLAALARAPR